MNNLRPYLRRMFILKLFFFVSLVAVSFGQTPSRNPASPRYSNQPQNKIQTIEVLKIRVINGNVSADISDSSLQKVLQELADRTGIIFEIQSQDNPLISIHLQEIPVQDAIERIIGDGSIIYEYNQSDASRISLVRILTRTSSMQQSSILSLGTGVITKINIEIRNAEQAHKVLASTADLEDRIKAIEVLAKVKGQSSMQALMEVLVDTAPEIRMAAIEGLASMKSYKALSEILSGLKDPDPGVRQRAISAVALLGTSRNIRDLKPLTFDKNAEVSAAAESAIQRLSATVKQ
jgi:hypothetical protein